MKIVSAAEMREIDRITIEEYGIPGLVLMERAGLAVATQVRALYPDKRALVLCGSGNNGGDGLVVARILFNWGYAVTAVITGKRNALSPDCEKQFQIAKKLGIPLVFKRTLDPSDVQGAVVIDAVFGTGLSKPVTGELAALFSFVNSTNNPVVSVDIPSGVSSDTGEVLGEAISAHYTVTFGLPKRGHLLYPGAAHTGKLLIEDIGFPAKLLTDQKLKTAMITRELVRDIIPSRAPNSFKGDYGHVLVLAGSTGKTGAALMVAEACMRTGAGLVTLGVPASLIDIFESRATEIMMLPLPDDGHGMLLLNALDVVYDFIKKIDAIAIGPGLGVSDDTVKLMTELVTTSPVPLIIDADGLNSLSQAKDQEKIFQSAKSPLILTPHPGEMARLLAQSRPHSIKEIEKSRLTLPGEFSTQNGVCLVLKGVPTVAADPDGNSFVNTTGNPGMATGGSGDVLTGIIASLVGQGINPIDASAAGVFIHGLAGDTAAAQKGEYSLTAPDIIDSLPAAFCAVSQ